MVGSRPGNDLLGMRLTWAASDPCWAPLTRGAARLGLLRWVLAVEPVDAAVPVAVAGLVAEALCHAGIVAFLDGEIAGSAAEDWRPLADDEGWLRRLVPARRLGVRLGRPDFPVVFTERPALVRRMFDDATFAWQLRSQIAFLLPKGARPPAFGHDALYDAWMAGNVSAVIAAVPDLAGVVRPGIDGDWIEFGLFGDETATALETILTENCRRDGIDWAVVAEPVFKATPLVPANPGLPFTPNG